MATIPELREAFERIMEFARKELSKSGGEITRYLVKETQEIWKDNFGKELESADALALLEYINSDMAPRKRTLGKTRRNSKRKQSGGMAPLDYQTRAGIDGVYGKFPPYVGSGFEVGVPQISQQQLCGKVDTTPAVTEMIGSNKPLQAGGRRRASTRRRTLKAGRKQAGGSKIILSTAPTTVVQDAVRGWFGQAPATSSPSPVDTAFEKYLP
jgi:predicted house-cleaning noncanonical NTP pyrophosphatase (MazG superfamily)